MNVQVPITLFNEAEAKKAWEDFLAACEEEKVARARRILAHQRFMAAFMGGAA